MAEGDGRRRSLATLRGKSYGMKWWPMTCLHTVNLEQNEKWWQAKVTTYWPEIVPEINVNLFFHYLSIFKKPRHKSRTPCCHPIMNHDIPNVV